MNFAVNVLGTYTMTESLLPLLEKAAPDARVITVSSGGMYTAPLTTDLQVWTYSETLVGCITLYSYDSNRISHKFVQFSDAKFNGVEQYARNKRIQV